MSTAKVFDVCIVGAGLWGSAAAKYCSERDNTKVCLVGPSEPTTMEERKRRCIFGAHYDEGRIYGSHGVSVEFGDFFRRSAKRFRNIEQVAGIKFYEDVGLLSATLHGGVRYQKLLDAVTQAGHQARVLDETELRRLFNFLSLKKISPETSRNSKPVGILQQTEAGHLSPRKLVLAQQTIARRQGCEIIDDVVNQLMHDDLQGMFKLLTDGGKSIYSKKVLLCTGASMAFGQLLPNEMQLDIILKTQVVVLIKLTEDERERLCNMPCITVHPEEQDLGRDCYILPPLHYPDGNCYLKIGHGHVGEMEVISQEQLKAWYCGHGASETSQRLTGLIHDMFPGLKLLSVHSDTCVTVSTPTGLPYCDMVTPHLGVLVGGNGRGAKSSDEIGRMGANMILRGEWDYDMPREKFRAHWKP